MALFRSDTQIILADDLANLLYFVLLIHLTLQFPYMQHVYLNAQVNMMEPNDKFKIFKKF